MRGDMDRTDRWLYRGVTLLVVALGVAAASRSWISLSALARDKGWQGQAPILPLCLEGFALAGTLMAWVRMRQGRGAKLAWLVAFVAPLLLSMAANMAHAWEQYPGDEVALAISSLPPAVWAACTALAVHYLRQARHIPTPVPVPVEALDDRAGPQAQPSQDRLRGQPPQPGRDDLGQSPAAHVLRGTAAAGPQVLPGEATRVDRAVRPGGWQTGARGTASVAGTPTSGTPGPGDPQERVITPSTLSTTPSLDHLPPGVVEELTDWWHSTGRLGHKKVTSTLKTRGVVVGDYRAQQIADAVKTTTNGQGVRVR